MTPKGHRFAPFRLDAVNQCLWRGTDRISLSPKAFSVLLYLADRPSRLVTKQELLDAVWPDIHVTEGVLKRAVLEIRKALSDPAGEPRYIQTLHRRGYRFLAPAAEEPKAPEPLPADSGVVGRGRDFAQLDEWFGAASSSSRQVVFISGEAGMGKSTLVESWMRALRSRRTDSAGVALARGRCLQQFGSGEPYLPVFEALEQLSQELGRRLVEHLRARAPTWLLHMPGLISLEDRMKLRDEAFGSTRERMLREITDALEALSVETPLVLALEDLHWSDPSTIDLISAIARRSGPARLMVLGTYRPSDSGGRSPLLAVRSELELHRQCRSLPLAYLSETETGEYLAARFAHMDAPALASALHRRTNGNPLYLVCLVDELERSGSIGAHPDAVRDIVPETLQQMFERQAAQLSSAEQALLDAAAAAGEAFSVACVAGALARDPAEVESQCEDLVRRHLILKRGETHRFPDGSESPGYAFVHALCRDALYRRIPPGRRARLHGSLGRTDEQLYESDPKRIAAQLAGHFELAGELSRALRYLRLAADVAASRCSNPEAAGFLERALDLTGRLPAEERASRRMDLLEQRGTIRLAGSDLTGAAADYQAMADHALAAGAAERRVRALLECASPLLLLDYQAALAAIETAGAELSFSTEPDLNALVTVYRSFTEIFLFGWNQEAADALHAALPKLNEVDLHIRSRAAWMEAAIRTFAAEYRAACESAERSRKYARKAGVFFDYFIATMYLNWSLVHRGDLGAAIRVARDGAEMAAKNGSALAQVWFTVRRCWVHIEAFDAAGVIDIYERHAAGAVVFVNRASNYPFYLWLAMARMGTGNYAGAWEALENLRTALDEGGMAYQVVCPMLHAQAECKLATGDHAGARDFAGRLVETAEERHEPSFVARGMRILAEIAIRESNFAAAEECVVRAREALERCEAWNVEWRVHATAAHLYARCGQLQESGEARRRSLAAAGLVAATLAGEPPLQQSFRAGVEKELAGEQASSAGKARI